MKIKKKRKGKHKIYSLLLASLTFTQLASCGEENIVEENGITYIDDYTNEHDFDTLDEIIVTYSEEGIELSSEATKQVEEIFAIENENLFTSTFCITKHTVERQLMEYANQEEFDWHFNDQLYNPLSKTISWNKAINIVYQNSLKNVSILSDDYSVLSKDDISYVMELLKEYILQMQIDYPELNIEEIACKLEGLSLFYAPDSFPTLASTARDFIVYFDGEQDVKTFDPKNTVSVHEFFHFVCFDCECENRIGRYTADGIDLGTPDYSVNLETHEIFDYQLYELYGLRYTFIEEAAAERVMYHYNDELPTTYFNYQRITDNIEFALSLDENYKMDSYVQDCIYQRPIHFIREFPVGNINTQENFTDNVRMLIIYDALLRYSGANGKVISDVFSLCETDEEMYKTIAEMVSYSQSQLTKLFFTNLITLNEKHSDEYNLTYYLYLVNLFDARMKQANQTFINIWGLPENYSGIVDTYENYFDEMKKHYIEYLTNYYQKEGFEDVFTTLNTEGNYIPDLEFYPGYVPKDRIRFYQDLEKAIKNDAITVSRKLILSKQ